MLFREKTLDKTILSFGPILEPLVAIIWSMVVDMLYRIALIVFLFSEIHFIHFIHYSLGLDKLTLIS